MALREAGRADGEGETPHPHEAIVEVLRLLVIGTSVDRRVNVNNQHVDVGTHGVRHNRARPPTSDDALEITNNGHYV